MKSNNKIHLKKTGQRSTMFLAGNNQNPSNVLGFIDPTYVLHRKPLPMVAHLKAHVAIDADTFTLVKDGGAIPVLHKAMTKERRDAAFRAAVKAIENMKFDYFDLDFTSNL